MLGCLQGFSDSALSVVALQGSYPRKQPVNIWTCIMCVGERAVLQTERSIYIFFPLLPTDQIGLTGLAPRQKGSGQNVSFGMYVCVYSSVLLVFLFLCLCVCLFICMPIYSCHIPPLSNHLNIILKHVYLIVLYHIQC